MEVNYTTWDEVGCEIQHKSINIPGFDNLTPDHQGQLLNILTALEISGNGHYGTMVLSPRPWGYEMERGEGFTAEQPNGVWMLMGWWGDRPKQGWIAWGGTEADRQRLAEKVIGCFIDGGDDDEQ